MAATPARNERVFVAVRVCPSPSPSSCVALSGSTLTLTRPDPSTPALRYAFDAAFPPAAAQRDVFYGVAAPLVDDVLAGYNASLLAYGQTGTGKTHTMTGPQAWAEGGESAAAMAARWSPASEEAGLLPRALARIFDALPPDAGGGWEAHAAYAQVYREEVFDLLAAPEEGAEGGGGGGGTPPWAPLPLREDPTTGVYVEGLRWLRVRCVADGLAAAIAGTRARATAATLLNAHSSRSHAIFFLRVARRGEGGGGGTALRVGTLAVVDLAGSERASKSGAWGARLEEAAAINLSLCALGNVVAALGARAAAPSRGKRTSPTATRSSRACCRTRWAATRARRWWSP